jgi:hypothetical protein
VEVNVIRICTSIELVCATCCTRKAITFEREGSKAFQEMSYLDPDFTIEFADIVHGWHVLKDGRSWCPHHRGKS